MNARNSRAHSPFTTHHSPLTIDHSPFTINSTIMFKHIIIISGLAVSLTAANAQYVKNYKRAADKFYKQGDYYSAAQYYERSLAGNKSVQSGYEPYQVEKRPAGSVAK